MNPILLKPQGNMTSQVILQGKVAGTAIAGEYYERYFDRGWQAIVTSLARLGAEYDILVCEGAGSPAEVNLKHRDLTNMRVARHLNAPTILVVDIDRGGAFAHVVGTLQLLEPEERALIRGIAINKFRGQRSLLESGIQWLEDYTGIPVLGVIPWREAMLPAEDSLDLLDRRSRKPDAELDICVLRLPRIANFTDFDPLDAEPTVSLRYLSLQQELGRPDAVILPGSKTTIADLLALQESGMGRQLQSYAAAGGVIFGICGGFQMLGRQVADPDCWEGEVSCCPGLDLLPVETVLTGEKITRQRQVTSRHPQEGLPVGGYEIHQGVTRWLAAAGKPLFDDPDLGLFRESPSIWGCYLHGLFENGSWRRSWLNFLRQRRGLPLLPSQVGNYGEQREAMFDALADFVGEHLNWQAIFQGIESQQQGTAVRPYSY